MLKVAKNLVCFSYDDKKVFMNSNFSRPLIFKKGAEQVERALKQPDSITDIKLLNLLKKFKILIEDEESVPKTHQKFILEGKKDLGLYMLVTQKCNLGCTYCLGDNPSYLNNKSMDIETAKMALEKAAMSMLPKGEIQVIYFGGEPLLNWELVKECINFVVNDLSLRFDVNFKNHITTNLTHLPPDFIEIAIKHKVSVLVDIDGNCNLHNSMRPYRTGEGSYEKIIENIKKIADHNIYYELRATITSENVAHLRDILKHHHNLKPAACAFPTLIPVDSEGTPLDSKMFPDPDIYHQGLKDVINDKLFDLSSICPSNVISERMLRGEFVVYGCGMILGNTAVIDHDGTVYPCIYFVGQDNFCLGNVNNEDNPLSQKNWYDKFYLKYEKELHVDNVEKCSECSIRYFCGGGCSVRLLSLKGDDEQTQKAKDYFFDINCKASWASIESAVRYFEEKASSDPANEERTTPLIKHD